MHKNMGVERIASGCNIRPERFNYTKGLYICRLDDTAYSYNYFAVAQYMAHVIA